MFRGWFERGFSLIEVVVALGILGFILLSLVHLFIVALSTESNARRHTTLLLAGQRQLEQLLTLPFTDPRLQPSSLPQDCSGLQWDPSCWTNTDVNHRWPSSDLSESTTCRCFIVWEVQDITPDRRRIIRLFVVPYPPGEGLLRPVMLMSLVAS